MTEPNQDSIATYITALLLHYGFELGRSNAEELIQKWLMEFEVNWVRLAVVEALYLGRYKAISVDQILSAWQRRGRPLYHFNHEFDRLICHEFSEKVEKIPTKSPISPPKPPLDPLSLSLKTKTRESGLSQVVANRSISTYPQDVAPENLADKYQPIPTLLTEPQKSIPLGIEMSVNMESTQNHETENFSAQLPNIYKNQQTLGSSAPNTQESTTYTAESNDNGSGEEPNWLRVDASKYPIDQFTPSPDVSDFYLKLKAVMGNGE